ncbi:hypothetical protein CesoFtcFv8_005563 [Champsocephalus esox]|uniref:Uncharacterized protein n=1 Tax=Champsocephalus esox TaxID=159716 RepID=A0AAN8HA68_9TELE|nr:hypothetical protein CesoFtcFv8_005563 [Champsocephalus esox]
MLLTQKAPWNKNPISLSWRILSTAALSSTGGSAADKDIISEPTACSQPVYRHVALSGRGQTEATPACPVL